MLCTAMRLTLIFTIIFSCSFAQNSEREEPLEMNPYQDEPGAAYTDSSHSAHWSIYIPISLLIAGAAYFGLADQNKHEMNSSDTKDALGSIVNSKRVGKFRDSSNRRHRQGYTHS